MNLTKSQMIILDYIKKFINEHGYSPTVREISKALAFKSPSTVHEHLKKLVNNGIIKMNPTKSRTIELLVENEYLTFDIDSVKIPFYKKENNKEFTTDLISIPKYILKKFNPKNIAAFETEENFIYIINRSLKSADGFKYLKLEKGKYSIGDQCEESLGSIISKIELY